MKLIQGERMELFEVAADQGEREELSRSKPGDVAALLPLLPPLPQVGGVSPMGSHDRDALAALGYFPEPGPSITPRDELLVMLERGNRLVQGKQWGEAQLHFAAVVARDPGNLWARMGVGTCRAGMGELAGADSVFRSILENHPAYLPALQNLAMLRLMMDDYQEAERLHAAVLELMPADVTSLEASAVCQRWLKKYPESLSTYRRLAAVRPGDSRVLRDMGSLLAYHLNDRAEAGRLWRQALAIDPNLPQRREMEREMQRWAEQ
jgi:Flp pilus assembly protein TadD